MLCVVEREGLTLGQVVFKKNQVFKLPDALEKRISKLSADQLATEQKKLYKSIIYRKATTDEIIDAYKAKMIIVEDMDIGERQLVVKKIQSLSERKAAAAKTLLEETEDEPQSGTKIEDINPLDF